MEQSCIFSDNFVVFTWKDAPDSDEYLTAPYFTWICKEYDGYFFNFINEKINDIIKSYKS